MPTKYRFTMTLFDEAVVATLKATAAARGQSISAFVTKAIQQAAVPVVPRVYMTENGCPRCDNLRAKDTARRRRMGMKERTKLPSKPAVPPAVKTEKKCPVCDRMFMPNAKGAGGEQLYCRFNDRRCARYANRAKNIIPLARKMYADARRRFAAKADTYAN